MWLNTCGKSGCQDNYKAIRHTKEECNDEHDDDAQMLEQLAEGIDVEEIETRITSISKEQDDNNDEGWVNEAELLSDDKQKELDRAVIR
jgi:hypothetical protein